MSTEINTFCLPRSIGLPSKKVFDSNMRTHKAEKSRNLAGVIKEIENKYENQIEYLQKNKHKNSKQWTREKYLTVQ